MVSFIEDIANVLERHGKCKSIQPKKAAKYIESCLRALDKITGPEEESKKMVVTKQEEVTVTTSDMLSDYLLKGK